MGASVEVISTKNGSCCRVFRIKRTTKEVMLSEKGCYSAPEGPHRAVCATFYPLRCPCGQRFAFLVQERSQSWIRRE